MKKFTFTFEEDDGTVKGIEGYLEDAVVDFLVLCFKKETGRPVATMRIDSWLIDKYCKTHGGMKLHSKQKNGKKNNVQTYAYRCLECSRDRERVKEEANAG